MIDITEKRIVKREATASGKIFLKKETIDKIIKKEVRKGDVFETARIAGINAVKQTQLLIPHCHQIPINFIGFEFRIDENFIEAVCHVKTEAKTGLEMESIVGVSIALNTIWDMVKYMEKDENGQYPATKITDIRILEKIKEKELNH